jgi:opine dehydrogenase
MQVEAGSEVIEVEPIAIIGAGNAGRAMAAYLSVRGYDVNLYNRWPNEIEDISSGAMNVTGVLNETVKVKLVTSSMAEALAGVRLAIMVVPAFAHADLVELMAPCLEAGVNILVHPGLVGGALSIRTRLSRLRSDLEPVIGEAVTSLFAARLRHGGVHMRQVLKSVRVGVLPRRETKAFMNELAAPFEGRFVPATGVLETSLNNVNPVYHCPVMLGNIGRVEVCEEHAFANVVTPGIVRLIEAVDRERVALADALGVRSSSFLDWLRERSGRIGEHLDTLIPAVFLPGGASPLPNSLEHRFITEDVPFGLVPWVRLGEWLGCEVTTLRSVTQFLDSCTGSDFWRSGLQLADLGISADASPEEWVASLD